MVMGHEVDMEVIAVAEAMTTIEQEVIVAAEAEAEAGTVTVQEASQAATANRWDSDETTETEATVVVRRETTTTVHPSDHTRVAMMTILANEGTRSVPGPQYRVC